MSLAVCIVDNVRYYIAIYRVCVRCFGFGFGAVREVWIFLYQASHMLYAINVFRSGELSEVESD